MIKPLFQAVLTSRPEGDFKVNNLRRRGQSVCDHKDADEASKVCVQQSVKETEQQWRKVLESAKQLQSAAEAEISQNRERKILEVRFIKHRSTWKRNPDADKNVQKAHSSVSNCKCVCIKSLIYTGHVQSPACEQNEAWIDISTGLLTETVWILDCDWLLSVVSVWQHCCCTLLSHFLSYF